jgi:hypothetical protein
MTFGLASFLSIFIPSLVGVLYLKKTERVIQHFIYFILLMCLVECIANYLFYNHQNNLPVYATGLFFETVFILLIQMQYLKGELLKKTIILILISYVLYYLLRLYKLGYISSFDTELRLITSIILIFTSGIGVVQQSSNLEVNIKYNPVFMLSFTILLFYAATLFVNAAMQLIVFKNNYVLAKRIWQVHSIINILTNLLFAFSIWLSYRQKKLLVL